MMPMYDSESFEKSLIPSHFKHDVREIMEIAVMLGWRLHVTGNQSVTIISPNEEKKYHFSSRRNSGPLARIRKDVVKFADPDKLVAAEILKQAGPGSAIAQAAADVLGSMEDGKSVIDARPETEEPKAPAPRKPKRSQSEQPKEAHIVSERPMVAKASEGKGYDSQTALERKWSDGSTDYKCVECDYSSPNRLSIRGHFAVHKKGRRDRPVAYAADVPNAASYAPNKNRVAALAQALIEAAAGVVIDTENAGDVARTALMWVHEQSKRGTEHAEEREPMTAEDTLNRIRTLLDDGSHLAARQEQDRLAEEVASLTARVEQAEALAAQEATKRQEAEQRAEATRTSLKALSDLLSEVTQEPAAG